MSDLRSSRLWRVASSTRIRAGLALGAVLGLGVSGTYAHWTDDVPVTGTSFTAGVLDIQVNNADATATTTLSMSNMAPGNTSAQVLTVKNNGTIPLKYTMTGGLSGANAADFGSTGSLQLSLHPGGSRTGSGNSATCTGAAAYTVTLNANTAAPIIGTRRGPLAAAGTEAVCFQVAFSGSAPSSLQGKTANAVFTVTGTSDVS